MERGARGLCFVLRVVLYLGGPRAVSRRLVCARSVSGPRDRNGPLSRSRPHCRRGRALRNTLGSARLEREGDRDVQKSRSRVSRSVATSTVERGSFAAIGEEGGLAGKRSNDREPVEIHNHPW